MPSCTAPPSATAFRLGDTSLVAIVERDFTSYGDECLHGGGKTLRDGAGLAAGVTSAQGALDLLLCNVVVIDAVLGVVKCDLGVKDGRIVGIGKAGNPAVMDGVDPRLIVSSGTTVRDCEGLIATAGAHRRACPFRFAPRSPSTRSPAASPPCSAARWGRSPSASIPAARSTPARCCRRPKPGRSTSASWAAATRISRRRWSSRWKPAASASSCTRIGAPCPAAIDCCLRVADDLDFQVQLHTDTLNESGFVEDTLAAIGGRTIHMYHTEGAGGGHAPDIIRVAGIAHCLPSSTNPTNPYTVNTFDEHLDMTMVCHHLNPALPEDVAFAESRIRPQTIAAEDVLHDIGAISMLGSDSQGMGRIHEVICRTWQLASKMKDQRGALPEEQPGRGDNARIRRYIAKYTVNAARTFGIAEHVGSLEDGKLADIVVWRPAFFGIKPELVIKGGFIAWGAMGDSAASLMTCEPVLLRPQWGAFGRAAPALSACFVHPAAIAAGLGRSLGLSKALAAGARHQGPAQIRHAVERRAARHPRRSADLRGVRRRRARHLRAGRAAAARAALHAALTGMTAARIGIGGPVGSGKTALIERLIPVLHRRGVDLAVVTNDLVTQEDAERVRRSGLIDPARVLAVEAGACPHTVIREDPTLNIAAGDALEARFPGLQLIVFESGGDNLASTFSLDLVDWWIFVIDVAGGDDIPRKRGPGILRSDLLVVNKTDLAPHVGVDLPRMLAEADSVRGGRPILATNLRRGEGVDAVADAIGHAVLFAA